MRSLFQRNHAPLTDSVVGDQLVSEVRVTLQPLVAHSRRITLEDEGGTIGRVRIGTDHEHRSLGVEFLLLTTHLRLYLGETQVTSAEGSSLLEDSLHVIVYA